METQDPELRKQLHLTTEDLRFADFVVRHVAEERHDVFLDGVGWEGGDEWIRSQFRVYLLCLLRTSVLQGIQLENVLQWSTDSDTNLTVVCRHRWSR